jgi:DNA-binding transcriptional ArsR family regulator
MDCTGENEHMGRLPDPETIAANAQQAATFLKSLTHPHRLMILCLLDHQELSVSELEQRLGLRQPTLSQQLAKLRAEGLVETRRSGKFIYYRLASAEAREVISVLLDLFCHPSSRDGGVGRERTFAVAD